MLTARAAITATDVKQAFVRSGVLLEARFGSTADVSRSATAASPQPRPQIDLPVPSDDLKAALLVENEDPFTWYQVVKAYSMMKNLPMADLATAESNYVVGKMPQAFTFASRARARLPQGGADWQRANDIIGAAASAARQRR